jgi:hypothetical protein
VFSEIITKVPAVAGSRRPPRSFGGGSPRSSAGEFDNCRGSAGARPVFVTRAGRGRCRGDPDGSRAQGPGSQKKPAARHCCAGALGLGGWRESRALAEEAERGTKSPTSRGRPVVFSYAAPSLFTPPHTSQLLLSSSSLYPLVGNLHSTLSLSLSLCLSLSPEAATKL